MDQEKVLNIAKDYADSVRKVVDTADVFLYGSYARGTATKDSDIDIAVVVRQLPEDYLHTVATLWKLTRGVSDDIEPVLLAADNEASGFLATVRKTAIAL